MKKLNLNKKSLIQMLLSISLIVFLMWLFTGGFVTSAAKSDIFSMKPHNIIAESDHWAFSISQSDNLVPYFLYKGKESPSKVISVNGLYDYQTKDESRKHDIFKNNLIDEKAVMDRHCLVGEKRWYCASKFASMELEKAAVTIVWKSENKTYSEVMQW